MIPDKQVSQENARRAKSKLWVEGRQSVYTLALAEGAGQGVLEIISRSSVARGSAPWAADTKQEDTCSAKTRGRMVG